MTEQDILEVAKRNKEFQREGRYEGAALALFGGLIYIIIIAIFIK